MKMGDFGIGARSLHLLLDTHTQQQHSPKYWCPVSALVTGHTHNNSTAPKLFLASTVAIVTHQITSHTDINNK